MMLLNYFLQVLRTYTLYSVFDILGLANKLLKITKSDSKSVGIFLSVCSTVLLHLIYSSNVNRSSVFGASTFESELTRILPT